MLMLALLSTVVGLGFEPKFHFKVDWVSGGVQTTLPIQNFSVRTYPSNPFVLTKKKNVPSCIGTNSQWATIHDEWWSISPVAFGGYVLTSQRMLITVLKSCMTW